MDPVVGIDILKETGETANEKQNKKTGICRINVTPAEKNAGLLFGNTMEWKMGSKNVERRRKNPESFLEVSGCVAIIRVEKKQHQKRPECAGFMASASGGEKPVCFLKGEWKWDPRRMRRRENRKVPVDFRDLAITRLHQTPEHSECRPRGLRPKFANCAVGRFRTRHK